MKFSLLRIAVFIACVAPVHAVPKATTFKPVIADIGKDSVTITTGTHAGYRVSRPGDDGQQHLEPPANVEIYKVTQWTKITLNEKLAKFTDLKKGMEARVTVGVDPKTAGAIAAKAPLAKW